MSIEEEDGVVHIPRQANDMLEFVSALVDESIKQELDATTVLATVHDYICTWLQVTAEDDLDEPLPVPEYDITRLN